MGLVLMPFILIRALITLPFLPFAAIRLLVEEIISLF